MAWRTRMSVFSRAVLFSYCLVLSAQNTAISAQQTVGSSPSATPVETKSMAANSTVPVDPAANESKGAGSTSGAASAPGAGTPAKPAAANPPAPDTKTQADPNLTLNSKVKVDPSYVVGVADSLFISVWKEPDLSGPAVVRPDGIITLPVVGDVHVAGLTTPQLQDLLTSKLKDIVADPEVTVVVREIRSRKAYLVGKVARPGAVVLTSPETVLQLLAEAGGPNPFAKPQNMYLLRTVDGQQKRIPFNYRKALAGSQPDMQIVVGDIIVVP